MGPDSALAAVERLLALVDDLCAASPVVLVVDNFQWADEASMIVWNRLAHSVDQLPLLLVAVCRRSPQRPAVAHLRRSVLSCGAVRLPIEPLPVGDVTTLVERLTGARPGPQLSELVAQADGNPLYVRELIASLLADGKINVGPDQAELARGPDEAVPHSLATVMRHRIAFIPAPVREMLAVAALLGPEFAVADLAAALDTSPSGLLSRLRQAIAAHMLTDAGTLLRFRTPLIRQALHDSLPSALRSALHRRIAEVLAESGSPTERVAEHLLASGQGTDRWTCNWIAGNAGPLAVRAPETAVELLERVMDRTGTPDADRYEAMLPVLAKSYVGLGRYDDAERLARGVLSQTRDTESAAEMRWVLALVLDRSGRGGQGRAVVEEALRGEGMSAVWRARFQALAALTVRTTSGDLDGASHHAREALASADTSGDSLAAAYALHAQWCIDTARRDHAQALATADRALAVSAHGHESVQLHYQAVEDRICALQNLDRLDDADSARREALADDRCGGNSGRVTLHVGSAVQDVWRGRWDDALASLNGVADQIHAGAGLGPFRHTPMLFHGVMAFIAGHRDDRECARQHIDAGLSHRTDSLQDREDSDFLLAAQALDAERGGDAEQAVAVLSQFLVTCPGQLTLVHPWIPDLTRLALDLGDAETARAALDACVMEADRETTPARAAAAAEHSRGLIDGDPAPVLRAATHYAAVGRLFEQAQALENAAVLTARQGRDQEARKAFAEAAALYDALGASWDLRRADTRLRPYGVRRGVRGPRPRASFGWEALTPTELKVAHLVAEGKSNPQVAADLFLSRRTVQTHVSHILVKLGVSSRVGIATEALRHTAPANPDP
jgi:DNA-binding CsgD family transcriptional regulator